jgi:hypothetical protein
MGRKPKYSSEDERKQAKLDNIKKWQEENKEQIRITKRAYYQANKEKICANRREKRKNKSSSILPG